MTTEEKRQEILHYCLAHTCANCELFKIVGYRNSCYKHGADIDRNYEALFGKEPKATPDPKAEPENILLHAAICDELKDLYRRKNTDYGDSFHKTYLDEGLAMSRIRLSDKLERFKRLTRSGEQNVKDESVRDTLIDLANYAIMTIVEMEREKR